MLDGSPNRARVIFALAAVAALGALTFAGCGASGDDDINSPDGSVVRDGGLSDGASLVDSSLGDGSVGPLLVVDYSYGNQVVGSQLKIDVMNGLTHNERTCCPSSVMAVPEQVLTSAERAQLEAWIVAASSGTEMTVSEPAAAGAQFGALVVYDRLGRQINIRTIASTAAPRTTPFNTSQAAADLQDFVVSYVDNKMPR